MTIFWQKKLPDDSLNNYIFASLRFGVNNNLNFETEYFDSPRAIKAICILVYSISVLLCLSYRIAY